MKLIQFLFIGLLLSGFSGLAQNVASTVNLTSGGLEAGNGGTKNTFYGYRSGNTNISSGNTFIGSESGTGNTGSDNTYIGSEIGGHGNGNVYVGLQSGANTGTNNTYIGTQSGIESNGYNNTFISSNSGAEGNGNGNVFIGRLAGYGNYGDNKLIINNSDSTPLIWGDFQLDQLKLNGKVGIGNGFANFPTTAGSVNVANYNLFVKGGILTEEVRVNLQSNWADYVFATDYKLKPLEEVENYIQENGHLENVPSAKKVKEEGIELGEMIKIQQEKIEELTLYLIQQHKEIKELKESLKRLNN